MDVCFHFLCFVQRIVLLRNFSIDFETPHIAQVKILESGEEGITFEPAAWVKCRINEKGFFEAYGEGWSSAPQGGIAFEEKTKRLVYRTSDLWCPMEGVKEVSPRVYHAPQWKDARLKPGDSGGSSYLLSSCSGYILVQ